MLSGDCTLHSQSSFLDILNQLLPLGSQLLWAKEHNVYVSYRFKCQQQPLSGGSTYHHQYDQVWSKRVQHLLSPLATLQ
jgi:hypothetical protein